MDGRNAQRTAELYTQQTNSKHLECRFGFPQPDAFEAMVPVVVSSVYRLPSRHDAAYDAAYTPPAKLQEAGILFSILVDSILPLD